MRLASRRPAVAAAVVAITAAVMVSANASYALRAITAIAAAAVLLRSARHRDDLTWPRRFFAAALLVGAGSGAVSAGYLLVKGHAAPIGSVSDWMYLMYAPLAVAAILTVPRAAPTRGGTVRSLADGVVAAGSLWYCVIALVVDPAHLGSHLGPVARGVTLAFPLFPVFGIAVLLSALPRAIRSRRAFLLRGGAALVVLGTGDVGVAVASWHGRYHPNSWIAAVSELGLLLMLHAAIATATMTADTSTTAGCVDDDHDANVRATSGFLVVGAPYLPLVIGLAVAAAQLVARRGISDGQLAALIVVGVGVVLRQLAAGYETATLVGQLATRERLAVRQAMTDPLTGLANRTAFLQRLEAALLDATQHQVAVALLDLNDFKDINDTHGHGTGDQVLQAMALLLEAAIPKGCVARIGGDEFAIFEPSSQDGGNALGAVIASVFERPVQIGTRPFLIRASVGVVLDERPPGGSREGDSAHLLAHADVAMYEAKGSKQLHQVPVVVLAGRARVTATATIRIREEISHPDLSQFRVVYQPVVDLHSGAIVAAEALLRWTHPDFGEIGPATFIPLAERVGSVSQLGDHVLLTAVRDLASWSLGADSRFAVGVNVSPRQLADPRFAGQVSAAAAANGLRPHQISIELTEEAFTDDMEAVVATIAELRTAGVWVAVDDFGTGYSSLSYLRQFDANVLKIDKEFVQASADEPRTDVLVRSVIAMADALELMCVAEGIETLEHLAHVRANGCRFGQGYLLARPMSGAELHHLLDTGHTYPVDVQVPAPPLASRHPVRLRSAG